MTAVSFDFRIGGGTTFDPLIGAVMLEPTMLVNDRSSITLPSPRVAGFSNGKATLVEVTPSPGGLTPAWAYRVTIKNGATQQQWTEFVGVPDQPSVAYATLQRFSTVVPPGISEEALQGYAQAALAGAADAQIAAAQAITAAEAAGAITDEKIAAAVSTPDSATRMQLDQRYSRRGEFFINAADYGVVGDGITENDVMLQAAIDAGVAFGPKVVMMPAGDFFVKHAAQLRTGTTIEGTKETVFIKKSGKTATMVFSILSEGRTGYGSGADGVTLRGFRIKGDFANNITAGAIGANHGSNILVDNVDFVECLGASHIFDLQGCDNVSYVDCKFMGANYPSAAARYNEAIQIDNSTRSGTSVLDAPGSYDGLPTKNVTVERCHFLPITVAGTIYPAPIPMGSHAGVDGYFHENIIFKNNIVDTPAEDVASSFRGILHFMTTRGITLEDNWFFNRNHVAVRAFSLNSLMSAIYPFDADNSSAATHTLAVPQLCSRIRIRGNKFVGFSNPNTGESTLMLRGNSTSSRIIDIEVMDNQFIDSYVTDLSAATGARHIELAFATDVRVSSNRTNGCRQLIYYATVTDLTIDNNRIANSSNAVPINGINGVDVKIVENSFDNFHGAVYDSGANGLEVAGNRFKNARTSNVSAIDINGAADFQITRNQGSGSNGIGVLVRGGAKGGLSDGNIMRFPTPYNTSADSTVLSGANLP